MCAHYVHISAHIMRTHRILYKHVYVSQNWNESNYKSQWYNILATFIAQFRAVCAHYVHISAHIMRTHRIMYKHVIG